MGNILEKNLEALKDKVLREKIAKHTIEADLELVSTNGYNLKYNNTFLHNEKNPLLESEQIFSEARNTEQSVHVIYGIGLGYLFQIAAQKSKGNVILYEPDLDILCSAFSLVDFSNEISQKNVFVFDDLSILSECFAAISDVNTEASLLSLPSYRNIFKDNFYKDSKDLELVFGGVLADYNFKKERLFDATINVVINVPELLNEPLINIYENKFKGQTAIIVSAGPTLSENIEIIKKNRDKFYIFVVGPALKVLLDNGITPDFLCIIESLNCSKQVEGLDLSDLTLILEPYTNAAIHKLKTKNKLLYVSSNMTSNDIWAEITGIDNSGYMTRGTVSFAALNSAVKLGFDNVIFVGQDLAYIDNNCYSKGSVYEDLVCELNPETKSYEIKSKNFDKFVDSLSAEESKDDRILRAKERLDNLNRNIHTVVGINGKLIATNTSYSVFINHFSSYAKFNKNVKFINTSMKGAQIDGFENMPLDKAVSELKNRTIYKLDKEYKYDKQKVYSVLSDVLKFLKDAKVQSEDCNKQMSRANMDFKRHRNVDSEILLKIKKAIELYSKLTNKDILVSKEYSLLTTAEEIDLENVLNTIKDYDVNTVPRVINQLREYYTGVINKLNPSIELLQRSVDYVEGLLSK